MLTIFILLFLLLLFRKKKCLLKCILFYAGGWNDKSFKYIFRQAYKRCYLSENKLYHWINNICAYVCFFFPKHMLLFPPTGRNNSFTAVPINQVSTYFQQPQSRILLHFNTVLYIQEHREQSGGKNNEMTTCAIAPLVRFG